MKNYKGETEQQWLQRTLRTSPTVAAVLNVAWRQGDFTPERTMFEIATHLEERCAELERLLIDYLTSQPVKR